MPASPRLLLHLCCAPCAAWPVPRLRAEGFEVAGLFFNPNIRPDQEHARRLEALGRFAPGIGLDFVVEAGAPPGPEPDASDGAARCRGCYERRLRRAAQRARAAGADAFSTTLLFSIHQRHELLRAVGEEVARSERVPFLYRDLRAGWEEGGRRYRETGLYRQRYCGCEDSLRERRGRRPRREEGGP